MSNAIEITNVGPIEQLRIPVPENGGVVVLVGRNGGGKSTALEGVRSLVTKKNSGLSTREDAPLGESGKIEWGAAKLTVGRRTSTTGELTVDHLEGKLDLAALVDPGMATAETNDARRIKALAALSGAEAIKELFYPLAGGEEMFRAVMSTKTINATDLVDLAASCKKDFELSARKAEDDAMKAQAAADACRAGIEGLDLDAPHDSAALQAALEEAIRAEQAAKAAANADAEAAERVKQARENLAMAEKSYEGRTIEEAEKARDAAAELAANAHTLVDTLERKLAEAKEVAADADRKHSEATRDVGYVRDHFALIGQWRATIDKEADRVPVPSDHVENAIKATDAARRAVEQGALVRDARLKAAAAKSHAIEAKAAGETADFFRKAAKGVDAVLASAIKCPQFAIRDGRLIVTKASRKAGECFYDDLSDGERWRLAIDLAIDRLDREGIERKEAVLTLPQHSWEGLDPETRAAIHAHAVECGVAIITAEATDGELRAEAFEGSDDASH